MVAGLVLRVLCICLLLFSCGVCFPATKGDYRYPYTVNVGSGGGSNRQAHGSRPALVNLQNGPSPNPQQPGAATQQPSSPTENQSPSSPGAPSMATGSLPSYEPNRFIVTFDSSSNRPTSAPAVPSQGARPPPPTTTRRKTPSLSVQPQSAVGTNGNSNVGSSGAASSPFYWSYPFPPPGFPSTAAGHVAPTLDFGDGPVPYIGAPITYNYDPGSSPHANTFPLTKGNYRYPYTATGGSGGRSGLLPPMVNLQYRPSASQQASSPNGNQSPSSQGAPSAPAGPSQDAEDVSPTSRPLPPANTDYRYPNSATRGSGGGSAPGSDVQSKGLLHPVVHLEYRPSARQQASSPTGNMSPTSQGAPAGPSQGAGDVSPTAGPLPPTDTSKMTPKPQSAADTSGNSNIGSGGAASSPVYWTSFPAPGFPSTGAGYMAPTLDFGDGPVPYMGAPITYNYGAGSSPHANSDPTKGNYRYPYTATRGSGGGSAPGSDVQSGGLLRPMVHLEYDPSAPRQASSPTGNLSPTSLDAPAAPPQGAPSAPAAPPQGAGDVSPTARPLPPTDTSKMTPKPQSAAGTSGHSNMGSGGAASSPVYWTSFPAPGFPSTGSGYMAPTLDFGDGPVPYMGAPITNYGAESSPHSNSYPPTKGNRYPYTATGGSNGGSFLLPPMVNLQYRPSAPKQPSSPNGNQSPSSQGAPAAPSHGAPTGPSQDAGNVQPTAGPLPPTNNGKTSRPQSAGTTGNSNMGSVGAPSSPVYWTSFPAPGFPSTGPGYMAPTLDFDDGPVPYMGAPVTYNYGAGSSHANSYPPTKGNQRYDFFATGGSGGGSNLLSEGLLPPMVNLQPSVTQPTEGDDASSFEQTVEAYPYGAPSTSNSGDGPVSGPGQPSVTQPDTQTPTTDGSDLNAVPVTSNSDDDPASDSGEPSVTEPARETDTPSPDPTDETDPDSAPATSNSGDGADSGPSQPSVTQLAGEADFSSSDPTDEADLDAAVATSITGDGAGSALNLPWFMQFAEGADFSFPEPNNWMPYYAFPDFSIWDSNAEIPESVSEPFPLPPSSYIIQSKNGYQRAREVLSHTKYSPEFPEAPVFAYKVTKTPPVAGSKGGP